MGTQQNVMEARALKKRRNMNTALAMRANQAGNKRVQAADLVDRMRDIELEQANRLYREIVQLGMELRYKARQMQVKRRAFALQVRKLRALGIREQQLKQQARQLERLEQRAALRGSFAGTVMANKVGNVANNVRELPRRFR